MAEVHYGDTIKLRCVSDGSYFCYKQEEKAHLIATSPAADYIPKFIIYHYHWDKTDPIPYAGSKKADSLKSSGNFRLSLGVDVGNDRTIVAPHDGKSADDPEYTALHAKTDRDGADDLETFFFVKAGDLSATAKIQYGDQVNIYNYSRKHPFVRHTKGSYIQCLDDWPAGDDDQRDTFIIEQILEQNV